MIRVFTALCKSLFEKLTDEDIFNEATGEFRQYDEKCPRCGTSGKLYPYGDYSRNLVSHNGDETVENCVKPLRFKCASCGATHALLSDIIIPYSPYSLRFKLTVLIAYFKRDMTVVAVCEHFGIAVSTLYSWKQCLLEHKELLRGVLENLKESAISFLQSLLESSYFSDFLRDFYQQHSFSFIQNISITTAQSVPP